MCWYCSTKLDMFPPPVSRSALCPICGKDVRSCRNCRFLDDISISSCRESRADPVADRERANFCEWFSLDIQLTSSSNVGLERAKKARDSFSALFGD